MTAPRTIGSIGERLDLLIRQGATFGPFTATMRNPAPDANTPGTPVILTGCTIRGHIRKAPADAQPAAVVDVSITDAPNGVYTWGLSASTTAAMSAGLDVTKPESRYVWDMELEDSAGRVIPLYWGEVRIHREVTRG